MEITVELLSKYSGGQLEVQNAIEGYLFRGEIGSISLEGNELVIEMVWVANHTGFGSIIPLSSHRSSGGEWVLEEDEKKKKYRVSLEIYEVKGIGDDRLAMNSGITNELAVFFPAYGSKLSSSEVVGMELEEVERFCEEHNLFASLCNSISCAVKCFECREINFSVEYDPEIDGESWIMIDIKVVGEVDDILEQHDEYLKDNGNDLIRLSYDIVG